MSEPIDDGGPAFPVPDVHHPSGQIQFGSSGMSLRNWFAGQALAGMLANPGGPIQANGMSGWSFCNCDIEGVVRLSLVVADAMLAARLTKPE